MTDLKREPAISIGKAQDVRRLTSCAKCGEIGDKKFMPMIAPREFVHGYCAIDHLGISGLIALGPEEFGKVSLAEIGPLKMKELCDFAGGALALKPFEKVR